MARAAADQCARSQRCRRWRAALPGFYSAAAAAACDWRAAADEPRLRAAHAAARSARDCRSTLWPAGHPSQLASLPACPSGMNYYAPSLLALLCCGVAAELLAHTWLSATVVPLLSALPRLCRSAPASGRCGAAGAQQRGQHVGQAGRLPLGRRQAEKGEPGVAGLIVFCCRCWQWRWPLVWRAGRAGVLLPAHGKLVQVGRSLGGWL